MGPFQGFSTQNRNYQSGIFLLNHANGIPGTPILSANFVHMEVEARCDKRISTVNRDKNNLITTQFETI